MNKQASIVLGVVVLLVLLGGGFLLFRNSQTGIGNTGVQITQTPQAQVTDTAPAAAGGISPTQITDLPEVPTGTVKEFTVSGSNFKFEPAILTVNKGDTVKITFKNTGGIHDFRIDDLEVETEIINGVGEDSVEFVADRTGTFEYYCSVGNHKQMGMKGTLTIQE